MPLYFDYKAHQGAGAGAGVGGDGGAGSPMTGTQELGGAGLSASIQDRFMPQGNILNASHQFFQPQIEASLLPNTVIGTGAESALARPMAGLESVGLKTLPGAESAGLNAIAGAKEAISPIIQMIMRLPGALGVAGSFFEALAAFFDPANWLTSFQWLHFGHHAQMAVFSMSSLASEHLPISLALLPSNAPIFQTLGQGALAQGFHTFGINSARLGSSAGSHGLGGLSPDALHISGKLGLAKPQFEGSGSALAGHNYELSGPHMSNNLGSGHLAGNSRLFSDKITAMKGTNLTQLSQSTQTPNTLAVSNISQTVSLSGQPVPSSLNIGSNSFGHGLDRLPVAGRLGEGQVSGPSFSNQIGHHLGTVGSASLEPGLKLGPSGAVTDRLGGHSVLASSPQPSYSDSPFVYRPQPASAEANLDPSASFAQQQLPASQATTPAQSSSPPGTQAPIEGLKAKELSFDAVKQSKSVTDHVGYQSKGASGSASARGMDNVSHRAPNKVQHSGSIKPGKASESPARTTSDNQPSYSRYGDNANQMTDGVPEGPVSTSANTATDGSTYTIQPGDNLWNIARNQMGSGYKWQEIYNINKDVLGANPDLIHPGTEIQLPGTPSDLASSSTGYTIAPGDNLWNIARDHLGGGKYWNEIYNQNADVIGNNPDLIFPGQELNIPHSGNVGNVASQPAGDPSTIDPQGLTPAPRISAEPASTHYSTSSAMQTQQAQPDNLNLSQAPSYAHPVLPAWRMDPPVQLSPGAVQAAATAGNATSAVSKSLQPDLSFLKKKR